MINIPRREGSRWLAGSLAVLAALPSLLPAIFSLIMFFSITGGYVMYNPQPAEAASETYSTAGSSTWTAPYNVTTVSVEVWGAGGAGGGSGVVGGEGGGAGGQYAKKVVSVTPGTGYPYIVGAGGTGGSGSGPNGGTSSFNTSDVVAVGGAGGQGGVGSGTGGTGTTAFGVGNVVYAGGSGGNGVSGTNSGGGGGGAGSTGAGGNASGSTGGTGTAEGGNGANGSPTATNFVGTAGTAYGGGGSGAYRVNGTRNGGSGASGAVIITYSEINLQNDPTSSAVSQSVGASQTFGAQRFRVNATDSVNSVQLRSVTVSFGGDATSTDDVSTIKIYTDSANNDNWDGTGSEGDLGGQFTPTKPDATTVAGSVVFSSPLTIPTGATGIDLWVAVTTKANPVNGKKIVTALNSSSDINVNSAKDNSTYPITSPEHTISVGGGGGPDASILTPADTNLWVSGSVGTPTKSYNITGLASDGASYNINTVSVSIKNPAGTLWWSADSGVDGSWTGSETWNPAVCTSGTFDNVTESYQYTWRLPVNIESSGYTIEVKAINTNTDETNPATQLPGVKIDTYAPRVTGYIVNSGITWSNSTDVTISATVTDTNSAEVQFSGDVSGGSWLSWSDPKTASVNSGDGDKNVTSNFREVSSAMDPEPNATGAIYNDPISLDQTAPTSSNFIPANGATGVATSSATVVAAAITDGSGSGVNGSTVTGAYVYLKNPSGVTVSTSVDWNSPTASINHPVLSDSTEYTAYITTGVKDNANNSHAPTTWAFTTATGGGTPSLTVSNSPVATASVNKPATKFVAQTLNFAASGDTATINSLTVAFTGTATSSDLGTLYLLDSGLGTLATAAYSGSGSYNLAFSPARNISAGFNEDYKVAADVLSGATDGRTFKSNLVDKTKISTNVAGANINTFSNFSSGLFTITTAAGPPAGAPTGFTVVAKQNPTVSLGWDPYGGATVYKVERSLAEAGSWDILTDALSAATTSYNDTAAGGELYYYRVYAGNGEWGPASNAVRPNVTASVAISGGGTLESADGQIKIVIPADAGNNGTWTASYTSTPADAPSRVISNYFNIEHPAGYAGTFRMTIKATEGDIGQGYNKSFWRYTDSSVWEHAAASNYSFSAGADGYVEVSADVTSFSGYLIADGVQNTTPPRGPHGDFADSTNKCKDCHAVHLATGNYKLLRNGASNSQTACNFCHGLSGVVGSKRSVVLNTSGHGINDQALTTVEAPDSETPAYSVAVGSWGCTACHSPHNNDTLANLSGRLTTTGSSNALLKRQPNPNAAEWPAGTTIAMSDWCSSCHGANIGTYGQGKQVPEGAGETTAYGHDAGTSSTGQWYKTQLMTPSAGGTFAFVPASVGNPVYAPTCPECHAAGNTKTSAVNSKPRFSGQAAGAVAFYETTGEGFLPHSGYSNSYSLLKAGLKTSGQSQADVRLDDVCNDCHFTPSLP